MKKLVLIICLSLFTFNLFSQQIERIKPPKKAYKIILTTKMEKSANFINVIESLLDNDFIIKKKDKEYGTIKTEPEALNKLNGSYFINIRVKNNLIYLTGKCNMNFSIDYGNVESNFEWSKIINKGMKGSLLKESFKQMLEFALKIKYEKIEFQ